MNLLNNKIIILSGLIITILIIGFFFFRSVNQKNYLVNNFDRGPNGTGQVRDDSINDDTFTGNGRGTQRKASNKGNCLSDDCLAVSDLDYPVSDLSSEITESLERALDDEYKAYATYDAVINKFGSTRPFIMILRAEEQHISSLKAIFDKYGVDIPENPYLGDITAPSSIEEACNIGVQAEIENAALYKDELLPAVQGYEDITVVFNNLMNASQEKHLPAFQRCSE